ncbi:hypothetical protein V7S43_016656 [Phytophthora oleae]|uniref:Uncharacterized protein n=1 Tax=Phytophthora oleae TaxID=2107226 RepID=A0ABD3EX34_9STRA
MFQDRRTEFYFHKRDDLCPLVLADLDELIGSMKKHAQAIWERTQWVTMDADADLESGELSKDRGMRRSSLIRQHNALVRKVAAHKHFSDSLFHEPGIWTVPYKCCPWIWQDSRAAELGGPPCSSLEQQLNDVDTTEPARTQWSTMPSDDSWMEYVPDDLKKNALTPAERSKTPFPQALSVQNSGVPHVTLRATLLLSEQLSRLHIVA